jgi:hypothetical protein
MRFLIVLITLTSSVSLATVEGFNQMITDTTQQERRLHRKLLQQIQNTQYAIAYNEKVETLQVQEQARKIDMPVRLVEDISL